MKDSKLLKRFHKSPARRLNQLDYQLVPVTARSRVKAEAFKVKAFYLEKEALMLKEKACIKVEVEASLHVLQLQAEAVAVNQRSRGP